jgi:hypothetical protein
MGTGFAIAPGVLATAAHVCYVDGNPKKPTHQVFEAIRSPDVGQKMESATLIAIDAERDIALLRISNPRANASVQLRGARLEPGASVGSLGFPLATLVLGPQGRNFNLQERFQGAYLSAFFSGAAPSGRTLGVYETDALMYSGSSGCPGFLPDASVWGMHVSSRMASTNAGKKPAAADRLAISVWVPSDDIASFATANGVTVTLAP